jgi:hypothetical protein
MEAGHFDHTKTLRHEEEEEEEEEEFALRAFVPLCLCVINSRRLADTKRQKMDPRFRGDDVVGDGRLVSGCGSYTVTPNLFRGPSGIRAQRQSLLSCVFGTMGPGTSPG